jgi:hypothetical protein
VDVDDNAVQLADLTRRVELLERLIRTVGARAVAVAHNLSLDHLDDATAQHLLFAMFKPRLLERDEAGAVVQLQRSAVTKHGRIDVLSGPEDAVLIEKLKQLLHAELKKKLADTRRLPDDVSASLSELSGSHGTSDEQISQSVVVDSFFGDLTHDGEQQRVADVFANAWPPLANKRLGDYVRNSRTAQRKRARTAVASKIARDMRARDGKSNDILSLVQSKALLEAIEPTHGQQQAIAESPARATRVAGNSGLLLPVVQTSEVRRTLMGDVPEEDQPAFPQTARRAAAASVDTPSATALGAAAAHANASSVTSVTSNDRPSRDSHAPVLMRTDEMSILRDADMEQFRQQIVRAFEQQLDDDDEHHSVHAAMQREPLATATVAVLRVAARSETPTATLSPVTSASQATRAMDARVFVEEQFVKVLCGEGLFDLTAVIRELQQTTHSHADVIASLLSPLTDFRELVCQQIVPICVAVPSFGEAWKMMERRRDGEMAQIALMLRRLCIDRSFVGVVYHLNAFTESKCCNWLFDLSLC